MLYWEQGNDAGRNLAPPSRRGLMEGAARQTVSASADFEKSSEPVLPVPAVRHRDTSLHSDQPNLDSL